MRHNIVTMEDRRNITGVFGSTNTSSHLLEKACNTVDNCLRIIEEQVARYLGEKTLEAPAFVEEALFENVNMEKSFHRLIISDCDILRLQQEIIAELNKKLKAGGYFVELKAQPVDINLKALKEGFTQNRGVVQASALASTVGGWSVNIVAGGAVDGIPGGELIEGLLGGIFQKTFDQAHSDEGAACAKRLLLSVTGLLQGIGHQIIEQISYQVAVAVYSYTGQDVNTGIGRKYNEAELPA